MNQPQIKAIDVIKKEHEEIEQHLQELDFVSSSEVINYPNLIHICRKCTDFLAIHEEKEIKVFKALAKEGFRIPIHAITFEHGELRKHREAITKAINKGSEVEVKETLLTHGKAITEKLRRHFQYEENILFSLPISQFSKETIERIENSIAINNKNPITSKEEIKFI